MSRASTWMNLAILLVMFGPAGTGATALGADTRQFRLYRTVEWDESQPQEILDITLDGEIYAASHHGMPSLRVVDAAGNVLPYRLDRARDSRTETVRETCPSQSGFKELSGNTLEITADLKPESPPATALVIRTPLKDFERQVQIFGSDDGAGFRPLVEDGRIFDYSRFMDVNNREIKLPANACRHFRIVIQGVTDDQPSPLVAITRRFQDDAELARTERTLLRERSLKIDGIELVRYQSHEVPAQDVKTEYGAREFPIHSEKDGKLTTVDVSMPRAPLTALKIESPVANFSRRATVLVPRTINGQNDWQEIGRGTIWAIHFRGVERQETTIEFPEQMQSAYRIEITNDDNPPIGIQGVSGVGNVYRARVLVEKGPLRLYYGSDIAEQPNYDSSEVLNKLDSLAPGSQTIPAKLGPPIDNPDYELQAEWGYLNNRVVFVGAITLMVIVLGTILYRVSRRIEALPTD